MTFANNLDKIFTLDICAFAGKYIDYIATILRSIDTNEINDFVRALIAARERKASIFFIGNGGSAATASHFANDLGYGLGCTKIFRVMSLTDNNAVLTALGNDVGYENIFSRQLEVLGRPRDMLVGISASGNSQNILNAFELARRMEITTVALTSFDGGKMRGMADMGIHVPTLPKEYGPAEDAHMILDHLIASYLMRFLANETNH